MGKKKSSRTRQSARPRPATQSQRHAGGGDSAVLQRIAHGEESDLNRCSAEVAVNVAGPVDVECGPPSFEGSDESTPLSSVPFLARGVSRSTVEVVPAALRVLQEISPQALGATYWFEAAPQGEPYPVTIRFTGRLRIPEGEVDSFDVIGMIDRVYPGSGQVALTVRVPDVTAGTWDVTARPVAPVGQGVPERWTNLHDDRLPVASASGRTQFAPAALNSAPGVRLAAWPLLVGVGATVAVVLQALLAHRLGLPVPQLVAVSLVACLLGLGGAKVYYQLTHRLKPFSKLHAGTGMSIQGFVIVCVSTLLAGAFAVGLPVGAVLDISAPGLLAGVGVGRLGCLLGGCCVGRPTTSRWGVWSSDRRVGIRRIPVQLMEAAVAALLAGAALLAVLSLGGAGGGVVFVSAVAAYTGARQILFPLRGIPRLTTHGRALTQAVSGVILLGALLVALVQ